MADTVAEVGMGEVVGAGMVIVAMDMGIAAMDTVGAATILGSVSRSDLAILTILITGITDTQHTAMLTRQPTLTRRHTLKRLMFTVHHELTLLPLRLRPLRLRTRP
jgi:hypothetical protein